VFDMFMQASRPSEDRQGGGLGVGLALARSLVQLHGGTIEAHSDGLGQGSEFVVRLPLAEGGESIEDAPPVDGIEVTDQPKRVLIVDDNHDHASSLALLLELVGHTVRSVHDGPSALTAAGDFRPEVALIDIGLPGLNGYEVARTLRADERHRDVVLIAQTGWGQEDDRRRTREVGFDHHLVKPVRLEDLRAVLEAGRSRS
jgi:CheY-like chemotaxis protein